MSTIVTANFAALVEEEYGVETRKKWEPYFEGRIEIDFSEAMKQLDEITLEGGPPCLPVHGKTTSLSGGEVVFIS